METSEVEQRNKRKKSNMYCRAPKFFVYMYILNVFHHLFAIASEANILKTDKSWGKVLSGLSYNYNNHFSN